MGRRMVNGLVYVVRGALAIALFGVVVQMGVALFLRGGVGSSVPGFVRSYELAELENVMDEREVELVEACFSAPDSAGVRRFVGHPSQLKPGSALARAFERAAELQASCAAPSEAAQGQATASSRRLWRANTRPWASTSPTCGRAISGLRVPSWRDMRAFWRSPCSFHSAFIVHKS